MAPCGHLWVLSCTLPQILTGNGSCLAYPGWAVSVILFLPLQMELGPWSVRVLAPDTAQHGNWRTIVGVSSIGYPLTPMSSAGMNAAVRAVVRMGIYVGAKVYFIYEVSRTPFPAMAGLGITWVLLHCSVCWFHMGLGSFLLCGFDEAMHGRALELFLVCVFKLLLVGLGEPHEVLGIKLQVCMFKASALTPVLPPQPLKRNELKSQLNVGLFFLSSFPHQTIQPPSSDCSLPHQDCPAPPSDYLHSDSGK